MRRLATVLLLASAGAACSCGASDEDQATGSVDSATWRAARDLPAGVAEALDSGNAAFRVRDLAAAKRHYQRATELGPEESAGWFGLAMVERQLGNSIAAESAMARVRALTPGASLIRPDSDTTGGSHP